MKFRSFHAKDSAPEVATVEDRLILFEAPRIYKTYPRFPVVSLPQPRKILDEFSEVVSRRQSERDFSAEYLSLDEVSNILFYAGGLNRTLPALPQDIPEERFRRHHPSGGGLYPLELYVAAYRVQGLREALYHYAPQSHSLEEIITGDVRGVHTSTRGLVAEHDPAAILVVTSVWSRSYFKYGEYAYRMALIESGHLMQDALLTATALRVKAAPIGGFKIAELSKALDLHESDHEDPLYLGFLGK